MHIAQGYALVILGLTLSLFLYVASIEHWTTAWWLCVHCSSIALVVVGGWWWWHMPPLTANWVRATEQFSMAALLEAYMIPFVLWWRLAPQSPFFTANVIVAFAAFAWLLLALGAIIVETGHILADRELARNGRLCMWLGPPLILVPLGCALAVTTYFFLRAGLPPGLHSIRVGLMWPRWVVLVMIISPVLVLGAAIDARLHCLRAARWLEKNPRPA